MLCTVSLVLVIVNIHSFIYIDVPRRHGVDVEAYRRDYRQVYASPGECN